MVPDQGRRRHLHPQDHNCRPDQTDHKVPIFQQARTMSHHRIALLGINQRQPGQKATTPMLRMALRDRLCHHELRHSLLKLHKDQLCHLGERQNNRPQRCRQDDLRKRHRRATMAKVDEVQLIP